MHRLYVWILPLGLAASTLASDAYAQTATYHLHKENSKTVGLFQLKSIGPDAGASRVTFDLKNQPTGTFVIKAFDTQAGVPNMAGTIPAGSRITLTLWMRKTANASTIYPRAQISVNNGSGASLCTATGTAGLTTTLTAYALACSTSANVTMTATDRFYVAVGVNVAVASGATALKAELDFEGVLNGNYDSRVDMPLPVPPPVISSITPASGGEGTSVTIGGANFGSARGSSSVTFNGMTANSTAWNAMSITAVVPSGATSGPVVVTVAGLSSAAATFTVAPRITAITPAAGPVGTQVTVTGANFGAMQPASTLTFNGIAATPVTWSSTSITAMVPGGATTGAIVVRANGMTSNASAFAVPPAITSVTPSSGLVSAPITIAGTTFGAVQGASSVTFNGVIAAVSAWSPTSIMVSVPAGAATGPVVVTVDGLRSTDVRFVVPPTVSSLLPKAARAGALVTISGSNFGDSQGGSRVSFGGVAASVTSWAATRIVAAVPREAVTGAVVVQVDGYSSAGLPFTVIVPGSIAGTVLHGEAPVPGAVVDASAGGGIAAQVTTGTDGAFTMPDVDPGTYELRATAPGFSTAIRQGIAVSPSTTTTLTIALHAPGRIQGTVTDGADGSPVAGAAVMAYEAAGYTATTMTSLTGAYALEALPTGPYTVRASSSEYRDQEQDVVVPEEGTSVLDVRLERAPAGPVQYAYDAVGRLIQVTDPSGDFAVYRYDLVGNIVAIDRRGGDTIGIGGFSPASAPVGARVVITGGGFDSAPGATTVTFNRVAATLESASPSTIVAIVPVAATDGPIVVETARGSAISESAFIVTASDGSPTITGFSPVIGTPGTPVVIDGTNFDPVLVADRIDVNGRVATPTAGTSTRLSTTVPYFASGGRISIATAFGRATSAADFYVVPPPDAAADVAVSDRFVLGSAPAVSIGVSGKIGLLLFDGASGQQASFLIANSSLSGNLTIFRPDGAELVTAFGFGTNTFVDAQTLPMSGTYTVRIAPTGGSIGSLTLNSYVINDLIGSIRSDGSGVPVAIDTPGQNASLTFAGTAGQIVSITATSSVWTSCQFGGQYSLAVLNPDGSTLASSGNACGATTILEHQLLRSSGIYTVRLDPIGARTGTATLAVYAFDDVTGPLATDGTPVPVAITVPGQLASLTFSGIAGQLVSGVSSSSVWTSCQFGGQYDLSVIKPDGSPLARTGNGCGSSTILERITLPITGSYTLRLDPYGANTGTASMSVYVFSDVTGPIATDGTSVEVEIAVPGQDALLTFAGTAGQIISASSVSGTWTSCQFGGQYYFGVRKPDGSWLANAGNGCGPLTFLNRMTLPATGTYTVVVDPISTRTGSATISVYTDVDVTGSIAVNGPSVPIAITTPGQAAVLSFTGVAGQVVTASVTSADWTACIWTPFYIDILRPDSSTLGSAGGCWGSATVQRTLPADGTYILRIDPVDTVTGTATARIISP